ncbi:RNA polymerase sigma-70 factor [Streptomyces sp. CdTB01]|uniref:RNA polymerase sigma-70 factor n=1 Tax=Streptomyces sp. CdTB01 TaxID=1725411 RepID=UPI00073A5690|nr:RNA polymerase sigma-70 factor [Streptomyces sp. CdTB01]ALV30910.1 RNA polymerase subunit sigma-24 [Streptomyces sp. CdTB01]
MTQPEQAGPDQLAFQQYRTLLFSVAYRILGTAADAEDTVQDAWLKWSAADRSQVADPKAYLIRIASNLAMERLRSTRHQRETYPGPWLPEPILTHPDTADSADTVAAAESISMALLIVLETLSPLERAVFVLKEVFAFSYAEIAQAVERSETAVRQSAHRARAHVTARRPRYPTNRAHQRHITERFLAATQGGDINTLMELLSPDVTLWTDGGGKVHQALKPVTGRQKVANWFAALATTTYQNIHPAQIRAELTWINAAPGIVFHAPDRVIATLTFDLDTEGRIITLHNTANPDKLHAITHGTRHHLP